MTKDPLTSFWEFGCVSKLFMGHLIFCCRPMVCALNYYKVEVIIELINLFCRTSLPSSLCALSFGLFQFIQVQLIIYTLIKLHVTEFINYRSYYPWEIIRYMPQCSSTIIYSPERRSFPLLDPSMCSVLRSTAGRPRFGASGSRGPSFDPFGRPRRGGGGSLLDSLGFDAARDWWDGDEIDRSPISAVVSHLVWPSLLG